MSKVPSPDSASAFWRAQLAGLPPALELPTRRAAAPGHRPRLAEHRFALPEALVARAAALGEHALLGAVAAWLHRTTRQTDLVLGVVADDRLLPLRLDLGGNPPFRAAAARLAAALAAARRHALALPQIAAAAGVPAASLLQVAAAVGPAAAAALANGAAAPKWPASGADLPLRIAIAADGRGTLIYDAELLEEAAVARIPEHLATLLGGAADDPDRGIGLLPFLAEAERSQILHAWNDKRADFPRDATLHGLFEARAAAQPDALAAVCQGRTLSYRELDARANQVAHHLRSLGVRIDQMVGISVERSLEMVIGLLAIAKAGAAYLPMDPAYPRERLAYMVEDSAVAVLLTQRHLADSLPRSAARVVFLDGNAATFDALPTSSPQAGATADNLAYVIYTSGSTGAPKGVVLNHRGRVNNFLDFNRRYEIGPGDALVALASLSFDMCAYDAFGTLAAGATVVLPDPDKLQDPPHWAKLMARHEVTVWHTAPAMLKMLVDHLEAQPDQVPQALRLVLLGGDWIPVTLPDRLRALKSGVRVISMGGATECSMDSTIYEVLEVDPAWNSIPYGEPMANQRAYVVDPVHLQPLPVGAPGELFLGGIGVGYGYHRRPKLTAERFLPDPFAEQPGQRMYRTGDLARWMPDGNLELLGRMDNQVKIRGYRIELGEIEARLRQHPAVREGVVVTRTDPSGEKRLVAYVVQEPSWQGEDAAAGGDGCGDGGSGGNSDGDAGSEQARIEQERVEQWQAVYDNAYSQRAGGGGEDPTFNIVSWDSSYTNQPIPAEQMRTWVDQTVERIRRHAPDRVLEIGCGMGLLLFRIAPTCSFYLGTDFSKVALDYVRRHSERLGLRQVRLERRWADDFAGIEPDSLDCVVLNSIVLDFPSMEYLMEVLRGAANAVRPGGSIFVGDVRSLPLLQAYQTSVQLFQASPGLESTQLNARVQRLLRQEEELVIDPRFFAWLPTQLPKVGAVQIQLKRGAFTNELNAFRYDVTLHVGAAADSQGRGAQTSADSLPWLDWDAARLDLAALCQRLQREAPPRLGVRGVPNARVQRDVWASAQLASADGPPTAGALRDALAARAAREPAVNPEEVWTLADDLGYDADLRWSADLASGRFDVALRRRAPDTEPRRAAPDILFPDGSGLAAHVDPSARASDFANNPMQGKLSRQLGPALRRALSAQLPDYMVPSVYVPLDAMPLSPNGKVDRKRLPEPDTSRPDIETQFAAPQTPVQTVVAGIWTDVLGLDRVGVDDAFLDLGGHSLLAVQIQARLGEIFPFAIGLPDIFESRTVARLADLIQRKGVEAGVDAAEICRMLQEIEQLSEEEVQHRIS